MPRRNSRSCDMVSSLLRAEAAVVGQALGVGLEHGDAVEGIGVAGQAGTKLIEEEGGDML